MCREIPTEWCTILDIINISCGKVGRPFQASKQQTQQILKHTGFTCCNLFLHRHDKSQQLSHQPDNIRSMHSYSQRKFIQEDCSGLLGQHLPSLQDLYNSRVKKWAGHIIRDSSHPRHNLFALLPSGRRYRSLCTRIWISRHKTAPPPHHAISSLNS